MQGLHFESLGLLLSLCSTQGPLSVFSSSTAASESLLRLSHLQLPGCQVDELFLEMGNALFDRVFDQRKGSSSSSRLHAHPPRP